MHKLPGFPPQGAATMTLRQNLTRDAVEALRVREAAELAPEATVEEAINLLQERAVGCVVITEKHKPVGVFTERDLLTKVLAGQRSVRTPLSEVMTRSPRAIHEDSTVADVIRTMHAGGFRHMPVVDAGGRLRGVVSVKRVVEYLVEHFPEAVLNLPPVPVQVQTAREGA